MGWSEKTAEPFGLHMVMQMSQRCHFTELVGHKLAVIPMPLSAVISSRCLCLFLGYGASNANIRASIWNSILSVPAGRHGCRARGRNQ